MPEVDEVVSNRNNSRGGLSRRPVEDETVGTSGGPAKVSRSGIEDETHEGGRKGRAYSKSVEDKLTKFETEDKNGLAAHEEGDADEDEPAESGADESGGEDVAGGGGGGGARRTG